MSDHGVRLEPYAMNACTFIDNMVPKLVLGAGPCGPQTWRRRQRWRLVGLTERFLLWLTPGVK